MQIEISGQKNIPVSLVQWRNAIRKNLEEKGATFTSSVELACKNFNYGNDLGILFSSWIYTETVTKFKYPQDWWEAFKERWFPGFLLKICPVKYKRFEISALYPNLQLPKTGFKGTEGDSVVFKINEIIKRRI